MMRRIATRLARMDGAELRWRTRALARSAAQRAATCLRTPTWDRASLARRLAEQPDLETVLEPLRRSDWDAAHRALSVHFASGPRRFVIHPGQRTALANLIAQTLPGSAGDAKARADRILEGRYRLLGYRSLRFATTPQAGDRGIPDWHFDPVNSRRAPVRFWAAVPYLDPQCGDHKIIWELNRHQHWLALGRAHWLTGHARYRQRFVEELSSWLTANPPLLGINWASMLELGFRSISWIWALNFFADGAEREDAVPWTVDLLLGIDRQLTHIEQNLSHYFSPNTHLLGEALALYVAGRSLPELASSRRWADLGRRLLIQEAVRQIEPDGGHRERSTHYHRYALDFYLLALAVARTTNDPVAAAFERPVSRLAAAARLLADDRGRAPHLGDDDGGMLMPITGRSTDDWRDSLRIAAALTREETLRVPGPTEEELWMLQAPPVESALSTTRSAALPDTGYYVSRDRSGLHVVIDGGPHGFRNAGHAHADALSLTVSRQGVPLVVDTGTACYTTNPLLRDRFRATQAHNTVTVDDRSQSLPSGPFHWSSAADATTHRWRSTDGFDFFDGSHAGYAPIVHRRRVFVLHGEMIVVADYLDGASVNAAVHWHIDPRWTVATRHRGAALSWGRQAVNLLVPDGRVERFEADPATGLGWYSPVYGRIDAATTIRISQSNAAPAWIVSVFDWNDVNPACGVEWLPVWAEAGMLAHGAALRIDRGVMSDLLVFAEPSSAEARGTWRVGESETDARMLFTRTVQGALARVAIVDGSVVRAGGRRSIAVSLGRIVPTLFIDEPSIRTFTKCAASPAS